MVTLGMWAKGDVLLETHIFEKAFPQERPRINKHTGSIYSPVDKQKLVRRHLMSFEQEPIDIQFWLTAHFFFREDRHYISCDTDNLVKALADSLQAMKVISNDNLMVGQIGSKNKCEEDWIWLELRQAVIVNTSLDNINKMPWIVS